MLETIRISARSSFLARFQALQVGDALKKLQPDLKIQYFFRESLGDKNLTDPLWKMPQKGVFTEDFLEDLLQERTDIVVHSWKDLPTERAPGTEIVATLPRADQRDLLLIKKSSLENIEKTKTVKIFSSSLRRQKNLTDFLSLALPHGPHNIEFSDIRGNIPTRIAKLLAAKEVDGLVLAKAAIDRLLQAPWPEFQELKNELKSSLMQCQWMVLPLSKNPNAAAQGALAIEIKSSRNDLSTFLKKINHAETFEAAQKEREILAGFGGGCHQKIGIAILPRLYGEIEFLQGLTDQGQILDSARLTHSQLQKTISESKKWSSSALRPLIERHELPYNIPGDTNALFVSRISAWRPFKGYVWAAGTETWKQLATLGVWVHGCSEGLGESEDPQIDTLAQQPLQWTKLTHSTSSPSKISGIATYQMKLTAPLSPAFKKEILEANSYFWTSFFLFEAVTSQLPEILNRAHSSGPGNTWLALKEHLMQKGLPSPHIYLSESEWRKLS